MLLLLHACVFVYKSMYVCMHTFMYGRFSVILEYNGTIMYVPLYAHILFCWPRPSCVWYTHYFNHRYIPSILHSKVLKRDFYLTARGISAWPFGLRCGARSSCPVLRGSYALYDALQSMRLTLWNLLLKWSDASEWYREQRRELLWNRDGSFPHQRRLRYVNVCTALQWHQ